jgi:hypothetical protein
MIVHLVDDLGETRTHVVFIYVAYVCIYVSKPFPLELNTYTNNTDKHIRYCF